jgi:hypothetical protein
MTKNINQFQVNQQQQQQMYMQQNSGISGSINRAVGGGGVFPNQNPNIGPLAYLEKTTSNIGLFFKKKVEFRSHTYETNQTYYRPPGSFNKNKNKSEGNQKL